MKAHTIVFKLSLTGKYRAPEGRQQQRLAQHVGEVDLHIHLGCSISTSRWATPAHYPRAQQPRLTRKKKKAKRNDLSLRWRSAELPWLRAPGGTPHASLVTAALREVRRGILIGRWGGGGGLGCLAWGRGRSEAVRVGLLRWGLSSRHSFCSRSADALSLGKKYVVPLYIFSPCQLWRWYRFNF